MASRILQVARIAISRTTQANIQQLMRLVRRESYKYWQAVSHTHRLDVMTHDTACFLRAWKLARCLLHAPKQFLRSGAEARHATYLCQVSVDLVDTPVHIVERAS
jgi:hypothetical protein